MLVFACSETESVDWECDWYD